MTLLNSTSQTANSEAIRPAALPQAVVTHAGRRDAYQLALALDEGGLLESLITDFYWNPAVYAALKTLLPHRGIPERICPGLNPRRVRPSPRAVLADVRAKIGGDRDSHRAKDAALGTAARRRAIATGSALFSYSYYASSAFRPADTELASRFLFQLHPHPLSVRDILAEEMERTPAARASLSMESEISMPPEAFESLAQEAELANGWAAASRYTARTLSDHGIPADKIHVVPYGVDLASFAPRPQPPEKNAPFTIVYVGSLIQRKGLSYLLDAVRAMPSQNIRLLLRGRGAVDWDLLKTYSDVPFDLKLGLPLAEAGPGHPKQRRVCAAVAHRRLCPGDSRSDGLRRPGHHDREYLRPGHSDRRQAWLHPADPGRPRY